MNLPTMIKLATTMTDQEELAHLNTAIEIAIANELDDERDAEKDAVDGYINWILTNEEAAEEAKMARDIQEYGDSLPNMPF